MAHKAKQQKLTFWVSKNPSTTEEISDTGSADTPETSSSAPANSLPTSSNFSASEVESSNCFTGSVGNAGTGSSSAAAEVLTSPVHKSSYATEPPPPHTNDIGVYVGKPINDHTKFQLIENPWRPPPDYKLPYSIQKRSGKESRRYLNHNHLEKCKDWVVYSPHAKGLYCKYCPWFTAGHVAGGQKTVPLQKLVTKPLTAFKDLIGKTGDLTEHEQTLYHKKAVDDGLSFLENYRNPEGDIQNRLDKRHLEEITQNRARLKPIVETVMFLGRQNIPFRGHRDDGGLLRTETQQQAASKNEKDEKSVVANEGNFRELLRYRVEFGDVILEEHLRNTSSRATYISKTTQNEIIKICGDLIRAQTLRKVSEAMIYSICFDETSDASHKSQLSLIVRYVHNGAVHEDFLGFVDVFEDLKEQEAEKNADYLSINSEEAAVSDSEEFQAVIKEVKERLNTTTELSATGIAIGTTVRRKMKRLGMDLQRCVGIGTDGCSAMISEVRGAVKEVQEEAVNAVKAPCYSHKLNNSLSTTATVPEANNAVGVMNETTGFFSFPKRAVVLNRHLGVCLKTLCYTRWTEKHGSVAQFADDLPKVLAALSEISKWRDPTTSAKASSLITALTQPQFIVAVLCLANILSVTEPLSKSLQSTSMDLKCAREEITSAISVLSRRREEVKKNFVGLWELALELAQDPEVDVTLDIPRRCARQTHRASYEVDQPEDYYRLSIYIPLLDCVITNLKERFPDEILDAFDLPILVPDCLVEVSEEELLETMDTVYKRFSPQLGLMGLESSAGQTQLRGEASVWREKWRKIKEEKKTLPNTAILALDKCSPAAYPFISRLLKLLATLPVSNASAERSFSCLRRLKTWLRSRMGEDRLSGLALMHIHRDVKISVAEVLDVFKVSKKRRIAL